MNVLITLSTNLLEKIISGEKRYEMRKCLPKHMKIGEDGFFIVEKGTDTVRCWCRCDEILNITMGEAKAWSYSQVLGVRPKFILNYAPVGTDVYLWKIGKVIVFECLKRDSLLVDQNPQQFAYTPLSYGESF